MEHFHQEMRVCAQKAEYWIEEIMKGLEFEEDEIICKWFHHVEYYLTAWLISARKQLYLYNKVCNFFF